MDNPRTPKFLDPNTPPTLFTLVIIAATAALSLNIFLPSLPAITEHFGADYGVTQFLVSGYLLTTAVVQFVVGPLSDRYGRRPVMLAGLSVFMFASAVCALAPTTEVLLTARVVQAAVVAGFAVSRAAIRDMVPGEKAASLIGYVTMGMAVAPMLAPMVGGILQELFGWQAAFWAMAIAGALTLLLVWRDMGETNTQTSTNLMAQVRLYPLLFKSRRFWAYTSAASMASACFFAMLGGAPFVGDKVYGLSPGALGAYFIFTPLGYMLGNFITGRYVTRIGISKMLVMGTLATIVGMSASLVAINMGLTHPLAFFGFTVSIGLGNGLIMPNATAAILGINPKLAGSAAGLSGAMITLTGAAISAFVSSILTVERGVYPLIYSIIGCAIFAFISVLYALKIEREVVGVPAE